MEQDKRLKFNPKNHHYTLEIDGIDKPITGVTTILKVISKPALINWAANMAVDYIANKFKEFNYPVITDDNLLPWLKEARSVHYQTRDKAGDIGKIVHKHCENYINGKPFITGIPQELKMVDNFVGWTKENKVKFLQSERQVYSEKYWFCGTYDFLCEIDGKVWLGDIKTSSGIYPDMFFQTAGYQICEEEMGQTKIDGHIILNLKKDGKFLEKRSISNKQNKEAFLSALTLYRAIESIKGKTL